MKKKRRPELWCAVFTTILSVGFPLVPYAGWEEPVSGRWTYVDEIGIPKTMWKLIDGDWYYFDDTGTMTTGWQFVNKLWYFLNPVSDGLMGKMLTGWQWIDGKCYYLNPVQTEDYPQGAMYVSGKTPDGFLINESGAWMDSEGNVQYYPGKGIQTTNQSFVSKSTKHSGGRGGAGGGSSGSGRNPPSSEKPAADEEGISQDTIEPGEIEDSGEPSGESVQKLSYTVKYVELEGKEVLKVLTAEGEKDTIIALPFPEIKGFTVCGGQKYSFLLTEEGMEICIYYTATKTASPSEAKKVSWELKFIEQGNPQNQVFKSQMGKTEENSELIVDFPEMVLGKDGYYYHSCVSSPWSILVHGSGTQKYYIQYQKGEKAQEENDPDINARSKLKQWAETAKKSDYELTGREVSDNQVITNSKKESNDRLLNLVAAVNDGEPHEIYVIARGHEPNALIVSQVFHGVINISEMVMDHFSIEGGVYTVLRVGFTKTYDSDSCYHDYIITDQVNATCLYNGHETIRCRKCGQEETVTQPAYGHTDANHDGTCDTCFQDAKEIPEEVFYDIGDIQVRSIGGKMYLFRCIDDDYEDAMNNSQKTALFLCDSVIRSDIDSTSTVLTKLSFGGDNNYKHSHIRKWLQKNALDSQFVHNSYIGITKSYTGSTEKGIYEQFDESRLTGYDCQFQLMEDKVFCLSIEEAVKYREYLWKFHGNDTNNPETQLSPYSKGYYLRSPQKGTGIYVVDLTDGSLHPAETNSTEIGLRPAMTIPQGG